MELTPWRDQMPQILERGLRVVKARKQEGYQDITEVLELLAGLPTPEEIIDLRPSPSLQARVSELLAKNRTIGLTDSEEQEWEQYEYLEHLIRLAKLRAHIKLNNASVA